MCLFNSKEGGRKDANLLIGIYRERSKNAACLETACVQFLCLWGWGRQTVIQPWVPTEKELYVSATQLPSVQRETGERGTPYNKVQLLTLQSLLCFSLLHVKRVLLDWCDFNKDRKLPPSQSRKKNMAGEEQGAAMETRTVLSLGKWESMKGTWSAQTPFQRCQANNGFVLRWCHL